MENFEAFKARILADPAVRRAYIASKVRHALEDRQEADECD